MASEHEESEENKFGRFKFQECIWFWAENLYKIVCLLNKTNKGKNSTANKGKKKKKNRKRL